MTKLSTGEGAHRDVDCGDLTGDQLALLLAAEDGSPRRTLHTQPGAGHNTRRTSAIHKVTSAIAEQREKEGI